MPTAMPLVAAGVGLGAGVAIAAWRLVQALLMPSPRLWAIVRVPMLLSNALVAGLSGALAGLTAAYVPLGVGLPALMARGASREASLIAMLLLLVVPPLLLPATWPVEVRADLLLFVIVLWHHAYLLIWPAWLNSGLTSGVTPPDLYLGVVVASALSVAAHTRATLYDSLGLDGAVSMGRGLKVRHSSERHGSAERHRMRRTASYSEHQRGGAATAGGRRSVPSSRSWDGLGQPPAYPAPSPAPSADAVASPPHG